LAKRWLFKEEPDKYPYEQLVEDGSTMWDGVRNNWAQKNMRGIENGDTVLYYHTGRERAVVGLAEVISDPYPDPSDEAGKRVVVDIEPVEAFDNPVTLAQIKEEECFSESPLVRVGRLSVVPITAEQLRRLRQLAKD